MKIAARMKNVQFSPRYFEVRLRVKWSLLKSASSHGEGCNLRPEWMNGVVDIERIQWSVDNEVELVQSRKKKCYAPCYNTIVVESKRYHIT